MTPPTPQFSTRDHPTSDTMLRARAILAMRYPSRFTVTVRLCWFIGFSGGLWSFNPSLKTRSRMLQSATITLSDFEPTHASQNLMARTEDVHSHTLARFTNIRAKSVARQPMRSARFLRKLQKCLKHTVSRIRPSVKNESLSATKSR